MKKILFVLAILLIANPTWAGLTIEAEQVGDTNTVRLTYDMDDTDPNLPRAFALEISLSQENDANIGAVTTVHPEFHVYPGSIVITGGVVTNQGAPDTERDANSIVVEMGSLYAAEDPCHTSPPAENGVLLEFMVQNNQDCHVNLAQNAIRGGVVMEDTGQVFSPSYVTLIECDVVFPPEGCECFGDITGDGNVSGLDLSMILSYLHPAYSPGYTAPANPPYDCADINQDGNVSGLDLSAILSYLHPAYSPGYTAPCMTVP
jgi:hypothetical protein